MRKTKTKNKFQLIKKLLGSTATAAMLTTIGFFSPAAVNAQDAPDTVFTNSTPFTVADRPNNTAGSDPGLASLYPSTINVTGLTGNITKVTVTMNLTHTFPDDFDILLVGPTGAKTLLLSDGGGSGARVNVAYTFDQAAATAFPDAGSSAAPVPAGTYKPANYAGLATTEPSGQDNFPTAGGLQAFPAPTLDVFNGTAPNGVWSLYVVDDQNLDVNGALPGGWSIDITTGGSSTGCTTAKRPLDYDGDGKTDPTVVRNTGGGPGGAITWFINLSNGGSSRTDFGVTSDYFVSGDFDGDGKSDITAWRAGPTGGQAYFYILQSQTNTLRFDPFGQAGDDPSIVGDYTGDGKADPAVYRAGANAGMPSYWYYRPSSGAFSGQVLGTQWGQNGDFPAPGDFDGDGSYDFVVQRNNGGGQAIFYLKQTTAGLTSFIFGTPTDIIVPGYYDNDCKTDIAVVRSSGGVFLWNIRNSTNGASQFYSFGQSATDFFTQGDYDGDGITDVSVWRSSTTPGVSGFYWRRSIDGASGYQQWGQNLDYPVANFNRH